MDIYTLPNVKEIASGKQQHYREISPVLCYDLDRWNREGRREALEGKDMGIYVCIWLIHFVVQQKLTQYCEAIILQ